MIEIPPGWGLVVDLDDTIYFERDFHDSGFRAVAARAGVRDVTGTAEQMSLVARAGGDALGVVIEQTGLDRAVLLNWHRTHLPRITPFPGAVEFLTQLVVSGESFAVVTDGRSVTQRNKLRALSLLDLNPHVFISEEVGVVKPDPVIFEKARVALGERPGYVYVADNPAKDFVAPIRMGWMTVMLREQLVNVNVHLQRGRFPKGHRAETEIGSWGELRVSIPPP